jgi:hypothetical protein
MDNDNTDQGPKPTLDCYRSEVDGIWVVHVDTEGIPEDSNGPRIRVYVNDGDAVFENPTYPGKS